jgi:SAM-dependent methyltransferase
VASLDRHRKPLRTVLCPSCGFVFVNPRPRPAALLDFYESDYRVAYKGDIEPKVFRILRNGRVALQRLAELSRHLPETARILDFGSGSGELLYLFQKRGYQAEGIEPNVGFARFSVREYGVNVHVEPYQKLDFPSASFDVVTSNHVFEHLDDPDEAFAILHRWLKPDGILALEVPNIDAEDQARAGKFHVGHVNHFSPATLSAFAARNGFALIETIRGGRSPVVTQVFRRQPAVDPAAWREWISADSISGTQDILNGSALGTRPVRRLFAKLARLPERFMTSDAGARAALDRLYGGSA